MEELGNVRDCIAAIERAVYHLHIACAPEDAIRILQALREYIGQSVDPKVSRLLPTVKALLAAATQDRPVTTGQSMVRSAHRGWWTKWVWRFSDSFLRQWTVLFQHFLLVLSVLGFTAAIGVVLGRLHVHIQPSVEPVLNYTDLGLITVFCLESFTLLALTATKEVLTKSRLLRPAGDRDQGAKRRAGQDTTNRNQGNGSSGMDQGAAAA